MKQEVITQKIKWFAFGICMIFLVSWNFPNTLKSSDNQYYTYFEHEKNKELNDEIYNGTASYYHNKFHGRKTASGERYNKKEYTAAIRMNEIDVPFGTIIEVKNVKNNKTVQVRVNDRMSNKAASIVDLSRVAAEEIGLIEVGRAEVEVRVISGE